MTMLLSCCGCIIGFCWKRRWIFCSYQLPIHRRQNQMIWTAGPLTNGGVVVWRVACSQPSFEIEQRLTWLCFGVTAWHWTDQSSCMAGPSPNGDRMWGLSESAVRAHQLLQKKHGRTVGAGINHLSARKDCETMTPSRCPRGAGYQRTPRTQTLLIKWLKGEALSLTLNKENDPLGAASGSHYSLGTTQVSGLSVISPSVFLQISLLWEHCTTFFSSSLRHTKILMPLWSDVSWSKLVSHMSVSSLRAKPPLAMWSA